MTFIKNIKKRDHSFTIDERLITLRLFETQEFVYGVTYAIRNPSDNRFTVEKEKEIVEAILTGRAKSRMFLTKQDYIFNMIVSNVMTVSSADSVLKIIESMMRKDFQSFVKFKVK